MLVLLRHVAQVKGLVQVISCLIVDLMAPGRICFSTLLLPDEGTQILRIIALGVEASGIGPYRAWARELRQHQSHIVLSKAIS
jgi:hypothetical protein